MSRGVVYSAPECPPVTELQWRKYVMQPIVVATWTGWQARYIAWARMYWHHVQQYGARTLQSSQDTITYVRHLCAQSDFRREIEAQLFEQALCADASAVVLAELKVRLEKPWDGGDSLDSPTNATEWTDVLRLVARAHFCVDPRALRLARVCKAFKHCWHVAEGCTAVDVQVIYSERLKPDHKETLMERENRDETIAVYKAAEQLKMSYLLSSFNAGGAIRHMPLNSYPPNVVLLMRAYTGQTPAMLPDDPSYT